MKRARTAVLIALTLALASGAIAQSLRPLLPAGTVFAVGVEGLSQQQAKLQPFIDEFQKLGVGAAFQQAFAPAEKQAERSAKLPSLSQLPKELQGLGALDVLGNEAYLAVSMSRNDPLPAVTFVANLDAKARSAAESLIAAEAKRSNVQKLTEDKLDFYVATVEDGSGGTSEVAYALNGNVVAVSSNSDVLRGVLRREQGSTEPSFTSDAGYKATLGKLGNGNVVTYLGLAPVGPEVQPLLAAQGLTALAQRIDNALATFGTAASVGSFTANGLESHGLQQLGSADKDAALYAMLSSTRPASTEPLAFVPQDALSVSSSSIDLPGWWSYLGGLLASDKQLGVGDLNQFVQSTANIDLQADLFGWTDRNVATIALPSKNAAQQPGVPGQNLLGSSVFVLRTSDPTAAAKGLADLFGKLQAQLAAFSSPSGQSAPSKPATSQVDGVTVTSYAIAPGVTLSFAVTGDHALISTSDGAIQASLQAQKSGAGLPATLAGLRSQVPADAHSFTLTDSQASMRNSAASLVTAMQTMAGLSGSQNLDVTKVKAASDALQKYLEFVASRLGGAVSYSRTANGTIETRGVTHVSW